MGTPLPSHPLRATKAPTRKVGTSVIGWILALPVVLNTLFAFPPDALLSSVRLLRPSSSGSSSPARSKSPPSALLLEAPLLLLLPPATDGYDGPRMWVGIATESAW